MTLEFVMYKITSFTISQNIWSEVTKRNFHKSASKYMAEVTNRLAEHCSCSYESTKLQNLNCRSVSTKTLTIKCSITVFTPVDRYENFPTGFLRLMFRFLTLTWPTVNWYLSEPAVMVYSSLTSSTLASTYTTCTQPRSNHVESTSTSRRRPGPRIYFRQRGKRKKRHNVSIKLMWILVVMNELRLNRKGQGKQQ